MIYGVNIRSEYFSEEVTIRVYTFPLILHDVTIGSVAGAPRNREGSTYHMILNDTVEEKQLTLFQRPDAEPQPDGHFEIIGRSGKHSDLVPRDAMRPEMLLPLRFYTFLSVYPGIKLYNKNDYGRQRGTVIKNPDNGAMFRELNDHECKNIIMSARWSIF
jgi:hypothetical protein